MDLETAKYIIEYFPNLMTAKEGIALRHQRSLLKAGGNPRMEKIYRKRGYITEDTEALELLEKGDENFRLNIAERIIKERNSDLYLNNCTKCGFLARTPQSRQCRNCGHKWHKIKVADFKLNGAFQGTNGEYYILGEIRNGNVEIGNFVDLTMIGMNCKPKIQSIEFVLKKVNGKVTEDIAFGTNELSESQKERLKKIGTFGTPFDIVNEK